MSRQNQTDPIDIMFITCRTKGHGSGCTTALSGIHRYLSWVYSRTLPTSLCRDNPQHLHRSLVERIQSSMVLATQLTFWWSYWYIELSSLRRMQTSHAAPTILDKSDWNILSILFKESTRNAATTAAKSLSKVTIKICDVSYGKSGERALSLILPVLLTEGITSNVQEVRALR